jgi:hypothetical protein
MATGAYPVASKRGQFARAGGFLSIAGDNQYSDYHLYRGVTHSNANWYTLFLDGAAVLLTVALGQAMTFDCLIAGMGAGDIAFSYRIVGAIKNAGGTTTLLASTVTTIYEDDADFDAQAVADDPNDALLIQVRDATSGGALVRWGAVVRCAEITLP